VRKKIVSICELPHTPDPTCYGSLLGGHSGCGGVMQLQEVRYFLAVRQERSFTRAARRCGVSQPSLTNAIRRLEKDLGGALFERKPAVALTVLGHAVHLYLQRIAENADLARDTAQALVTVADHRAASVEQLATSDSASVLSISSGALR
jgi:DNA-binding transcriptional LysR family regulator